MSVSYKKYLYGPKAPETMGDLHLRCIYSSKPGNCEGLTRGVTSVVPEDAAEGSGHPRYALIMLQYRRGHLFKEIFGSIIGQDAPVDVYIWNNNVSPKARCGMEKAARALIYRAVKSGKVNAIRSLWIHHSPVNIGPPGAYVLANTVAPLYDHLMFLDDDSASTGSMVSTFVEEAKMYPRDMISTWPLKFLNMHNYWDRIGSTKHEVVAYAGSAQFIAPARVFGDIDDMFNYFPKKFMSVTDLWLNAYICDVHGGQLRRSGLPEHASLDLRGREDKRKSVALSEYAGMRALKTEFMQYIASTSDGGMLQRYFQESTDVAG